VGRDAQPSALLGDGQHPLPPKTACHGVTETAPVSWQKLRGLCSAPARGGCRQARGQAAKEKRGWQSTGERSNPPARTVSPELGGAGSRVKTRGAGLDRVLLGRDNVRRATLQRGRRKVSCLPVTGGWTCPPTTDVPPKSGCQGREQGAGKAGTRRLRGLLGRGTSTACRLSTEPGSTPLESVGARRVWGIPSTPPKQTWAPTPGNTPHRCPSQPPPAEPGSRPSPVRECNRLLGKVCRISGRVSSSPGKRPDTHGQGGRAGPSCYSARGSRWQEAAPCSGRNAWGETGLGVRRSAGIPAIPPWH